VYGRWMCGYIRGVALKAPGGRVKIVQYKKEGQKLWGIHQ
jgi:hypothetical protein